MTTTLLTLAWTVCTAHYHSLPWFNHECANRLYACLSTSNVDEKACVEKSWGEKICDPTGNCF